MPTHTSHAFESELQELKDRLLAMGSRCEQLTLQAIKSLETRNTALAETVLASDHAIDSDELAVDELAIQILALRQPVGRDLRFIVMAIKVVTDLERIGDEAVNIAERALELGAANVNPQLLPGRPDLLLSQMGRIATTMLRTALDAFVAENPEAAKDVLEKDSEVDALYGQSLRVARELIRQNPDEVGVGMQLSSCAKYIERIADHATNIAEMVIFVLRGEDVRHANSR